MRKLLLGVVAGPLLGLGLGCHAHVGGECDCAAVPGDSVNHNPHVIYHAGSPVVGSPTHSTSHSKAAPTTVTSPTNSGTFEAISAPKTMPPK